VALFAVWTRPPDWPAARRAFAALLEYVRTALAEPLGQAGRLDAFERTMQTTQNALEARDVKGVLQAAEGLKAQLDEAIAALS